MGKILFFDIDGVLTYDYLRISPNAVEALEGLRAKGHHPILCTGRGTVSVPQVFLDHSDGWITLAGCACRYEGKTLFSHAMDRDKVVSILREAERTGVSIYPESDDCVYAFNFKENETNDLEQLMGEISDTFVRNTDEWIEKHYDAEICKFSFTAFWLDKVRQFSCLNDDCILVDTADGYYEINQKAISKGTGIKEFLSIIGSDPKDAYCFGDSDNDLEMFEVCGYPIATGNALDSIKAKARMVTEPASKGGVYKFLKEQKLID